MSTFVPDDTIWARARDSRWHHVAVVLDERGQQSVYVDGERQ